jgi:hypothetical protein
MTSSLKGKWRKEDGLHSPTRESPKKGERRANHLALPAGRRKTERHTSFQDRMPVSSFGPW